LMPQVMDRSTSSLYLVRFMIIFVGSPKYVSLNNRSKLVEVVSMFTPDRQQNTSRFFDQIAADPLAISHFGPALMQFYIDVEASDFYARLNTRNNAQLILKDMWQNAEARKGLVEASKAEGFVRFVMLLLNDTTFLLDEARSCLISIKKTQHKIDHPEDRGDSTEEELRQTLRQSEDQARALIQLVEETLNMFDYLTTEIVQPFLRPELIGRLAGMLGFNLQSLVAPKDEEISQELASKYKFDVVKLLKSLVNIHTHIAFVGRDQTPQADFVAAVANDGRSYSRETMEKSALILESCFQLSADLLHSFRVFVAACEEYLKLQTQEDLDLGEIPDEFADPIMCDLMKDPVELPSSHQIVDRSTITAHLLSDPMDPFNRQPLWIDQVIPRPDVKAKIEAWKANRHKEAAALSK
jgi:ubiquitin conjugation factor E4 B